MPTLFLLLAACAPTLPSAAVGETGDSAHTGGSETGTSADGVLDADTALETLEGDEASPAGLCQVSMVCGQTIPDDPKIMCDLTIREDDGDAVYAGPAGVELRGRSSLSAPKHQYSVELRDSAGADVSVNLFGMGADPDWVLNGMYYDRALVRNALAFDLFRAMGPTRYAPEFRYCSLMLDGVWQGVYHLTERPKIDDDRIAVADDADGGSFVVKQDHSDYLHESPLANGGWNIVSPGAPTAAQVAGIEAALSGWESAALANPATLGEHIDLDAFADLVLLEEFMKNNDAFYLSLHLWKDTGGLIQISPWDLDLALGQPSYNDNENPHSWIAYRPALVTTLAQTDGWDARLETRWAELRAGPFAEEAILSRIDGYQTTMGESIETNFQTWPIDTIQFGSGYLYPVSSYAEEDARVRAWIQARLAWMDDEVARWGAGP